MERAVVGTTISLSRIYDAPVEDVWDAVTNAERLPRWLLPVTGELRLTLEHHVPEDDHWRRFGPGAVGVGWDMAETALRRHLESGAPVDPDQAMAWFASAEGRDFVTASAQAWGEAHAADGAADARAAAERTAAAYAPQS